MCGIAGFCGPSTRFSDDRLRRMLQAIEHRGPDDSGQFAVPVVGKHDSKVWMGTRRLAIQDLSEAGHQPMVDTASGNAIAFNGEIYNFAALRTALECVGRSFRSSCDTEVALKSWCHDGLDGIRRWRGMFGVALWDNFKQELWLVRDEWGIKPLYYYWNGESLAFCSEVRGLLASGVVAPRLEWRGVQDYLTFGAVQDPVTLIEGVYALLPGEALIWSEDRIEVQRYAEPFGRFTDGPQDLESMLREIVQQQLISDVPVAVFLSGGVDSSIISLLARQEAGPSVNTMSVVFEEAAYSERNYARRVAKHIGSEHHEVCVSGDEACETTVKAIDRMDQPTVDGINNYVICQAAKKAGFTVALSGLGGDEFFGGYGTFRRTRRLSQVLSLCRRAPVLAHTVARLLEPVFALSEGAPRKFSQYLKHADFQENPFFLQRTVLFPPQIASLSLNGRPSPMAELAGIARYERLLQEAAELDPGNQVSFLEARTYMANMLLRDSDQMSMAHSLELRVPLVDQKLAAYLFTLSGDIKGFGRKPKLLLRKAFEQQLPPEVFTRKKMGFTLPFSLWLNTSLHSEVDRILRSAEFWDPKHAIAIWDGFRRGKLDWSRPWAIYVLSRWISKHILHSNEMESGHVQLQRAFS